MATATATREDVTPKTTIKQLLAEKYQRMRDQAKKLYQEGDACFEEIREVMEVGERVVLDDGRVLEFVDNYAKSNVAFRPVGVKRFELNEVPKSRMSKPGTVV